MAPPSNLRAFIHDATHALRDPLTACRGHLELLGGDPAEQRRTIALVIGELERMTRTIDDLHLLSHADDPDFVHPKRIDLELFTHEIVAKAGRIADRQWRLDDAEGTVFGDGDLLAEAAMRLAHNAVQRTEPQDVVAIGARIANDQVRIWVRDTASDNARNDQERIMSILTRGLDNRRCHTAHEFGAAVANAIARAHGGRIEIESKSGSGTAFTIVLPRDSSARALRSG
jgi:two-component system, OmpR family, sensor kinase